MLKGGQFRRNVRHKFGTKGAICAGMSCKMMNQRGVNYPEQGVSFAGMGGQFKSEYTVDLEIRIETIYDNDHYALQSTVANLDNDGISYSYLKYSYQ